MVCEVIISTLLLRVGKLSMVLSAYSRLNFMATAFSIGYMTISCSSISMRKKRSIARFRMKRGAIHVSPDLRNATSYGQTIAV